ncbi:MAG: substrate-binding domain-containing protein [Phototrophicaceae bacterium]
MKPTIVIITDDHRMPFQQAIITGISAVLGSEFDLLIESIHQKPQPRSSIKSDLSSVAGIFIIANILTKTELETIATQHKPTTLISHYEPELPIPAILENNIDGMMTLVDYLVENCKRRQIVAIHGALSQFNGMQRAEGLQRALKKHALTIPDAYQIEGHFNPVTAANEIIDFMDTGQAFDAILAADYLMGCAVLDVLRLFEVAIPEDVAIVAFGDGHEAGDMGLTVAGIDGETMGRYAAQHLHQQIQGLSVAKITRLDTQLIVRESS